MHMSDALLSPTVGGVMTAVSAVALSYSVKKIKEDGLGLEGGKIPVMSVMGAFVFAGQMINFTIPGTGSSGHIGGGILLAAILGPFLALLTHASVLLIQCLFFADGGLLAYGSNVFNLGVISCLLAYPIFFKPFVKNSVSNKTLTLASVVSVVLGLQAGAFFVVLETLASGITQLPFGAFVAFMQPIHLAIGVAEGLVTASVLCFIHRAQPELLDCCQNNDSAVRSFRTKGITAVFLVLTLLVGGGLSLFASSHPDGLEWSMEKVAGTSEIEAEGSVHNTAGSIVDTTAFMPDYSFPVGVESSPGGTSAAGIVGSLLTGASALVVGLIIHSRNRRACEQ